jgi:hypothetical protein
VVRCEEYRPSRRSRAPFSPGAQRSVSSSTPSLYLAAKRLRAAVSTTSGSGASAPAAPALGEATPVALRALRLLPQRADLNLFQSCRHR